MSELESMLAINTQTEYEHYKQGSRDGYARGLLDAAEKMRDLQAALSAAEDRARRARLEGALEALCEVTGACDTYGSVRLRTEILPRMLAAAERETQGRVEIARCTNCEGVDSDSCPYCEGEGNLPDQELEGDDDARAK